MGSRGNMVFSVSLVYDVWFPVGVWCMVSRPAKGHDLVCCRASRKDLEKP